MIAIRRLGVQFRLRVCGSFHLNAHYREGQRQRLLLDGATERAKKRRPRRIIIIHPQQDSTVGLIDDRRQLEWGYAGRRRRNSECRRDVAPRILKVSLWSDRERRVRDLWAASPKSVERIADQPRCV